MSSFLLLLSCNIDLDWLRVGDLTILPEADPCEDMCFYAVRLLTNVEECHRVDTGLHRDFRHSYRCHMTVSSSIEQFPYVVPYS